MLGRGEPRDPGGGRRGIVRLDVMRLPAGISVSGEKGAAERVLADLYYENGIKGYDRGGFWEARRNWKQALETYRRLGLEKEAAETLNNLDELAGGFWRLRRCWRWLNRSLGPMIRGWVRWQGGRLGEQSS